MQYNAGLYNAHQYNTDFFALSVVDSVSSNDTIFKSVLAVKLDSTSLNESKLIGIDLSILLESINNVDTRTMLPYIFEIENLVATDLLLPFIINKGLIESLTLSEIASLASSQGLADFLFFSELIKLDTVNKALNDILRLNDWMTIKKLFVEQWYD